MVNEVFKSGMELYARLTGVFSQRKRRQYANNNTVYHAMAAQLADFLPAHQIYIDIRNIGTGIMQHCGQVKTEQARLSTLTHTTAALCSVLCALCSVLCAL